MIQVNPGEKILVLYQLDNPADFSTTYHVRAIVRNSLTGNTLATLTLDRSSGRYSLAYQVSSVKNLHFDIEVQVFADAGFTDTGTPYGVQNTQYIVNQFWTREIAGFGGGGISDEKLRQVLVDVLGTQKQPEPQKQDVRIEKVHFAEFESAIDRLRESIETLPEPEKVDFEPVLTAVKKVDDSVKALPSPTPETDLQPVLNRIDETTGNLELQNRQDDILKRMKEFFSQDIDAMKKDQKTLISMFRSIAFMTLQPGKEKAFNEEEDTENPQKAKLPRKGRFNKEEK